MKKILSFKRQEFKRNCSTKTQVQKYRLQWWLTTTNGSLKGLPCSVRVTMCSQIRSITFFENIREIRFSNNFLWIHLIYRNSQRTWGLQIRLLGFCANGTDNKKITIHHDCTFDFFFKIMTNIWYLQLKKKISNFELQKKNYCCSFDWISYIRRSTLSTQDWNMKKNYHCKEYCF